MKGCAPPVEWLLTVPSILTWGEDNCENLDGIWLATRTIWSQKKSVWSISQRIHAISSHETYKSSLSYSPLITPCVYRNPPAWSGTSPGIWGMWHGPNISQLEASRGSDQPMRGLPGSCFYIQFNVAVIMPASAVLFILYTRQTRPLWSVWDLEEIIKYGLTINHWLLPVYQSLWATG